MTDESGNNSNNGLYFIVGALVIVAAIGAYVLFGNAGGSGSSQSSGSAPTSVERTTVAPTGDGGVSVTQEKKE